MKECDNVCDVNPDAMGCAMSLSILSVSPSRIEKGVDATLSIQLNVALKNQITGTLGGANLSDVRITAVSESPASTTIEAKLTAADSGKLPSGPANLMIKFGELDVSKEQAVRLFVAPNFETPAPKQVSYSPGADISLEGLFARVPLNECNDTPAPTEPHRLFVTQKNTRIVGHDIKRFVVKATQTPPVLTEEKSLRQDFNTVFALTKCQALALNTNDGKLTILKQDLASMTALDFLNAPATGITGAKDSSFFVSRTATELIGAYVTTEGKARIFGNRVSLPSDSSMMMATASGPEASVSGKGHAAAVLLGAMPSNGLIPLTTFVWDGMPQPQEVAQTGAYNATMSLGRTEAPRAFLIDDIDLDGLPDLIALVDKPMDALLWAPCLQPSDAGYFCGQFEAAHTAKMPSGLTLGTATTFAIGHFDDIDRSRIDLAVGFPNELKILLSTSN